MVLVSVTDEKVTLMSVKVVPVIVDHVVRNCYFKCSVLVACLFPMPWCGHTICESVSCVVEVSLPFVVLIPC